MYWSLHIVCAIGYFLVNYIPVKNDSKAPAAKPVVGAIPVVTPDQIGDSYTNSNNHSPHLDGDGINYIEDKTDSGIAGRVKEE